MDGLTADLVYLIEKEIDLEDEELPSELQVFRLNITEIENLEREGHVRDRRDYIG